MTARTIGLKYLTALFDIARERGTVEDVKNSLVSFSGAVAESDETKDFLLNPKVGRARKKEVLLRILEGSPTLVRDFVSLLVDKGRASVLVYAGAMFTDLIRESENVLVATVQTARPLDESYKQELVGRLQETTGKTITLREEQNEEIISGVRILFGSRMIDASLKNRLEKMRRALTSGGA